MKSTLHTSVCRRLSLAITLAVALFAAAERPAMAQLAPGLDAAFTVDALIGAGSLVSIIGNSVDLGTKRPHRAWMYSGFILGSINTAIGVLVAPIILATSGPQPVAYGNENMCVDDSVTPSQSFPCGPNRLDVALGLAAGHSVIGIVNLALAIRNAMLYRRLGLDWERQPPSFWSHLRVAPMSGRDMTGAPLYGASVSLVGF